MLKKGYLKPRLTIETIGKRNFWYGIFLWFLASNILCLGSNFLREIMRLTAWGYDGDLFMRSAENFNKFDLFFSFLSTTLAFGLTIYFWNSQIKYRKKRHHIRYASYVAIMYLFLPLTIITRFGTTLYFILYNMESEESSLALMDNFGYMFLLIPIYIFFNFWNSTVFVFRTRYWVLISAFIIVLSSLLFDKYLTVDKEIANSIYYKKYSVERNFVDSQSEIAKSYGIEFSPEAIKALKKRHAKPTFYLVNKSKEAFNTKEKVSLEFLFLEKILIHNLHYSQRYYNTRMYPVEKYGELNWHFAIPEQVYYQILQYDDTDCIELKLLFDILSEQISLFNINNSDLWFLELENMSNYESNRLFYGRNLYRSTETVLSRLVQVRNMLYANEKYIEYRKLLPEIEFKESRRQKWIEIEL